jgi:hypothetical protein
VGPDGFFARKIELFKGALGRPPTKAKKPKKAQNPSDLTKKTLNFRQKKCFFS